MTAPSSTPDLAHAGHPYRVGIEAERQGWYEVVSLVRSLTPEECLVPRYYRPPDSELADVATPANEMVGWSYHHDRDLTGFIDVTENPPLMEAMSVALIPPGIPGEGGSILLLQQWEHDAVGWEQLPVATQEGFIGRRKADSAELDPLPPASHVARTDQDRFGKIFRRNIAYGTLTRRGTIFVGFSHDQGTLQTMLESMLGADGGPPDELLAVTHPLTVGYYVVPAADRLAAFGRKIGA